MSGELKNSFPGVIYWCLTDPSWTMLGIDGGCEELTGYDCSALKHSEVTFGTDLIHPDDRDRLQRDVERALAEGEAFEVQYRIETADGETKWVHESGHGISDAGMESLPSQVNSIENADGGLPIIEGYIREIATESPLEAERDRKAQLLDSLFDSIPIHLFVKDEQGRHLYVSEGHVSEYEDSLIGKTDLELDGVDESHRRSAYEDDMHVIETSEPILDKEEYIEAYDKWNLTSKVPWRDETGETIGLIGIARDITERKKREQEIQRQNERLEQFTRVVSHDLRNPLNVAEGRIQLALKEADEDDANLTAAQGALDRMEQLLDDLLALARQGQPIDDTKPVSIDAIADRAWSTVPTQGATLTVVESIGAVHCAESRIQQLFENLFRNSVEHGSTGSQTPPGGAIEHGSIKDEPIKIMISPLDDGFFVADTGTGVPESIREQVLEPGYTTADDGTGFGLSIVNEIADAHGWELTITDSETGGARFEFRGVKGA
ncbi:PAS domain-containing sensor histidine kinase [Halalkalirubrum salinum]|uniref:PAS domain-containing sensor histidine kinase n=1 Tax=Halalkalirubrum salinum TaxID=2563889 RepID=UPI0010FB0E75|nr:PAS domain-containing protein [Halalkalirubrum salinum]